MIRQIDFKGTALSLEIPLTVPLIGIILFRSTTAAVMAAIIKESQLEIEFAKMRGNRSLIGSTDKGAFRRTPHPLTQNLLRLIHEKSLLNEFIRNCS